VTTGIDVFQPEEIVAVDDDQVPFDFANTLVYKLMVAVAISDVSSTPGASYSINLLDAPTV
jgi:hypothetical protein